MIAIYCYITISTDQLVPDFLQHFCIAMSGSLDLQRSGKGRPGTAAAAERWAARHSILQDWRIRGSHGISMDLLRKQIPKWWFHGDEFYGLREVKLDITDNHNLGSWKMVSLKKLALQIQHLSIKSMILLISQRSKDIQGCISLLNQGTLIAQQQQNPLTHSKGFNPSIVYCILVNL